MCSKPGISCSHYKPPPPFPSQGGGDRGGVVWWGKTTAVFMAQNQLFFTAGWTMSILEYGDQNVYIIATLGCFLNPNQEVFVNLTRA